MLGKHFIGYPPNKRHLPVTPGTPPGIDWTDEIRVWTVGCHTHVRPNPNALDKPESIIGPA